MNLMVKNTIEGFIRKLKEEGHSKYASELRSIIAMSRQRKEALNALSNMTGPLLTHLIKYLSMPQSRDRNKWHKEIKGYLSWFNVRNKNHKGQTWLSLEYIQKDLNDVLSSPEFYTYIENEIETYPNKNLTLSLLKNHKTIKSLEVKIFYDSDNNLKISIKNQPL